MKEKLIALFKLNNGYLLASQARDSSMRYQLRKMLKSNEISRVHHGLYVLNSYQKHDERELVRSLVPQGVFCLFSAWSHYELSTTIPYQHHVAIHRNTKYNLPPYPPIKLYFWSKEQYQLGITEVNVNGKTLKYYNLERSVCNAVKFRNKVGEDVMLEVLKAYVSRDDKNLDRLMSYAKQLRVEKIITPYLKTLLP